MTYSNKINEARHSYSFEWEMTSNFFKERGYYDWCAKNIKESSNVLEIGIGIGNSSLSILNKKCKILGIEENKYNIEKAIALFKHHKIFCGKILRGNEIMLQDRKYSIDYLAMDEVPAEFLNVHDIVVIEGDFLLDGLLKKWLKEFKRFDTIICWFTGVHGNIYNNSRHSVESPTEYRMLLHDYLFEFGPSLLNPEGVINICDRFSRLDNQTMQVLVSEMEREYKFEERNLEIKSTDQVIVDGFDTPEGIQHDDLETNISGGIQGIYSVNIGIAEHK